MKTIRKSLELTPKQFAALYDLAREFDLSPGIGPTPKRPSWRILIREIASGTIILNPKEIRQ